MWHVGGDEFLQLQQHFGCFFHLCIMKPTHALVCHERWARLICEGEKTWELRGVSTSKRERIAIAQSGSSKLVGEVTIVDSVKIAEKQPDGSYKSCLPLPLGKFVKYHCVSDLSIINYASLFAWVLTEPHLYESPRPYQHKKVL